MLTNVKTLAQRVLQLRAEKGWTQGQLAAAAGVSQGSIGNIENGTRLDPRATTLTGIAQALGVDAHWLSSAEGEMRRRPYEVITTPSPRTPSLANTSPAPNLRAKVPLISWIQAGAWCQALDLIPDNEVERWMDCPASHSNQTFALRVRGDSMTAPHGNTRTYPEGCFIFVDPERRTPCNGDRVVACMNGTDEVTFKIYKNEDGRQWLQPLNPSHEPIREKFHILGTVLGKWEDG